MTKQALVKPRYVRSITLTRFLTKNLTLTMIFETWGETQMSRVDIQTWDLRSQDLLFAAIRPCNLWNRITQPKFSFLRCLLLHSFNLFFYWCYVNSTNLNILVKRERHPSRFAFKKTQIPVPEKYPMESICFNSREFRYNHLREAVFKDS